jgi:hypothetical protein
MFMIMNAITVIMIFINRFCFILAYKESSIPTALHLTNKNRNIASIAFLYLPLHCSWL